MKTTIKSYVIILIIVIAMTFSACGNKNQQSLEEKYDIKNCSVVYSVNGSAEYYNYGEGTDESTVFELASNGKTVAAYTALAMVDDGVLALDEKISTYLDPDLLTDDARIYDITLRQLLSHTAGFSPNYELGVDKKIYTDPGTKFCYSGVGYIYLQSVIENASGMTMEQAATHYVFEPLGMKNSTFESSKTVTPYMSFSSAALYSLLIFIASFVLLLVVGSIIGKLTKFKHFSFRTVFLCCFIAAGVINTVFLLFFFVSKVFVLFFICYIIMAVTLLITKKHSKLFYASVPVIISALLILGFTVPASVPVTNDLLSKEPNCAYTFKSTCEDMSLFCNELMEKAKGSDGVFSDMFIPTVKIDDNNAWGLGIAIESTNEAETTYWHSGINPGFQSLFVLYPEQNKYIVVLTNSDNGLEFSKETARSFIDVDGEWDIKRQ